MLLLSMRSAAAFLLAGALHAQAPAVTGVYNTASLDGRLSPGCLAIVRGTNLGFGDADVTIGGQPAPVIFGTNVDIYLINAASVAGSSCGAVKAPMLAVSCIKGFAAAMMSACSLRISGEGFAQIPATPVVASSRA